MPYESGMEFAGVTGRNACSRGKVTAKLSLSRRNQENVSYFYISQRSCGSAMVSGVAAFIPKKVLTLLLIHDTLDLSQMRKPRLM